MEFGCIGEHLSHSFSKEIHALLQDYAYELKELSPEQLEGFLKAGQFKAINVTIPYKQAVLPYLAYLDPMAEAIGAVNTIVNRSGALYGYNTDFGGMADLIRHTGIQVEGKKVLIFGTGGTSKTALAVAAHLGAREAIRVSRTEKPDTVTYEAVLQDHLDSQVLINTTPKGMYANQGGMPMDPGLFPNLCGVIDAVYNPLRTEFVRKAQALGVPAAGGLYMLVRQAVLASELFLDTKYPDATTEAVYEKIRKSKENIVLTGMPGSGKTTVGKALAQAMNRPYFDTDELIEETYGATPAHILQTQGEAAFRDMESSVIRELSQKTGCILSTGGGAILRKENVELLRANGKLFFLDRPLELLIPTQDRPLSATREAMTQRYQERYPIYLATADAVIQNRTTPEAAVKEILK